jgi:signal transduction histidine kinase
MDARLHERARIARELHDDVGQRLALLTSRLSNVSEDLHQEAFRIAAAVQELSHELHPSSLDVRGIVAAIRSFCREFAEQQNVKIDVDAQDISARLPSEVSITLFRVLQEALHNAAKHSGTRHCEVMLRQRDGRIRLVVCDRGAGFDPEMAQRGRGIGLTTMRERVELIGGRLSIASRRKQGTRIDADVPITLNGQ